MHLYFTNLLYNPLTVVGIKRFCLFSGLFLYTELIFQIFTETFSAGFIRTGLFILLGTVMLTLITLCLPKLAATLFSLLLVLFISILSVAQLIYIDIFNEFFSIELITYGGEAMQRFGDILLTSIEDNFAKILLLLLPFFALLLLMIFNAFPVAMRLQMLSRRRFPAVILRRCTLCLSVKHAIVPFAALCILRYSLLIPAAADFHSPYAVLLGQGEAGRISSVREVGLFTTMEIDLLSYVFSSELSSVLDEIPEIPGLIAVPTLPPVLTPAPPAQGEPGQVPPGEPLTPRPLNTPPPWQGKFNSFDIDFDTLVERDKNNRGLLQLHEYYSSIEPSEQHEKTGLFEGYNLITISAEAFTKWVIDPELTPTLYMMQNEGVNFERFYSIYGAGTIGGEFALCTGLPPRGAGGWCTSASRKYMPFSFASRFLDIGIQPLAYHNGSYTYYDRNKLFPGLGYIFKANGNGLNMAGQSWNASDLFMMEQTVDEYIDMERFYVHYMTISGHSPYGFGNAMAGKNRDAVSHLPYSTEVRAYIATQLEFEYAMAYLLERLEEAGIAERTVIVITSDHYPYGLAHSKTEELAGQRLDKISELYESSGIIYVKGMEPLTVTAPAFVADMLPTVLNLLGLEFDSRFLPGRDVFSDAFAMVYLESSIITELGIYNKHSRNFKLFEGFDEIPEGYVSAITAIEAGRKSAIEQFVRLDYFDKIREFID